MDRIDRVILQMKADFTANLDTLLARIKELEYEVEMLTKRVDTIDENR